MTAMTTRTVFSKVKPDDHIAFKPCADDVGRTGGLRDRSAASFGSKVKTSLLSNHSMFGWADKGQWESVDTPGSEGKSERDWFRIGFEPIFVDFTKNGSWFMIYTLVEVSYCSLGFHLRETWGFSAGVWSAFQVSFLSAPPRRYPQPDA